MRYVLPVVGAVIGGIYGGPSGAQAGWAIGSVVGSLVDPETVQGPQIGDLTDQTSQEGVPRPIVFALSSPIAGNVIAQSPVSIVNTSSRSGKGGPVTQSQSAYRTYAIGICETIDGFVRVWKNGIIVYDINAPAVGDADGAFSQDDNTKFLNTGRFYLGTFDQTPDPDLEAIFGVGHTPAFRGSAYMVMVHDDVTSTQGAIPQFTFQVGRRQADVEQYLQGSDVSASMAVPQGPGTVEIQAVGPGAGGGGGGQVTFLAVRKGGRGGGGGAYTRAVFAIDDLPSTLDLYVGKHGEGGLGFSTTDVQGALRDEVPGTSAGPAGVGTIFDGSIVGTSLNVTKVYSGSIKVGDRITGPTMVHSGVLFSTSVTSFDSGSGDIGTYNLSDSTGVDPTVLLAGNGVISQGGQADQGINGGGPGGFWWQFGADPASVVGETGGVGPPGAGSGGGGGADAGSAPGGNSNLAGAGGASGTPNLNDRGSSAGIPGPDNAGGHSANGGAGPAGSSQGGDFRPLGFTSVGTAGGHGGEGIILVDADHPTIAGGGGGGGGGFAGGLGGAQIPPPDGPIDTPGDATAGAGASGGFPGGGGAGGGVAASNVNDLYPSSAASGHGTVASGPGGDGAGGEVYVHVIIGADGTYTLAGLMRELAARIGVDDTLLDVSALEDVVVRGLTITNQYPCSSIYQQLSQVFFFDPSNFDGIVHMVPRGADATDSITNDLLVDEDGNDDSVDQVTRSDQIVIPRTLNLNYYDVDGALATSKQTSDRSGDRRAQGDQSITTAVVMNADEAYQCVVRNHKVMIEDAKGSPEFSLSDAYLPLTPAQCLFYEYDGELARIRITQIDVQDGYQKYTANFDRQSSYTSGMNLQGIPAVAPTPPLSTVVGPTEFAILDIQMLKDSDDLQGIGYYVAVSGTRRAWRGALVELSRDGGATYEDDDTATTQSIFGAVTTALPSHPKWYPDRVHTFQVTLSTADAELQSTDLTGLLSRKNLAIVGDEVIQFQDVDEVSPGVWALSTLLRGRNETEPAAHATAERFIVLVRTVVAFIPAQLSDLGKTLTFRATSIGETVDTATTVSITFHGETQTERAPGYLSARRAGADLVVTWRGVGRLSSGWTAAQGVQFKGYQITMTDGTTTLEQDTVDETLTQDVSGLSGPITITVAGLNGLTGEGHQSQVIIA